MRRGSSIDKHRYKELWNSLEKARGKIEMSFTPAISYLRAQEEKLSIEDLMILQEKFRLSGVNTTVAEFLSFLISSRQSERVLTSFGSFGLVGALIADRDPNLYVDVISQFPETTDVLSMLNIQRLSSHIGPMKDMRKQLTGPYDVIITGGPVGQPRERRTFKTTAGEIELRDWPTSLLIADATGLLSANGFIISLVSHGFLSDMNRSFSVRANLEKFGLHLSALIFIRPGAYIGSGIGFPLAVIDRKEHRTIFVAEVPNDDEGQKALVERIRKRKQGPTANQGRLVAPEKFYGLAALEARERYDKLAKNRKFRSVPFTTAIISVQIPRRRPSDIEHCEEHPHAVYLPEIGLRNASTRRDEQFPKAKSYIQFLVDPEVVLPEYFSSWLNAPLGQALRQSVMVGATMPRIQRSILNERKLYLPSIEDQRTVIKTIHEIQRVRSELGELEEILWDRPQNVTSVAEAVSKVNHEDHLADWIETLPLPLASILRSYHAIDRSPKEKYERLLHFFEAFTVFCAAIHLSAIKANDSQWQHHVSRIRKKLDRNHLSMTKSSFGSWRVITELMAANLRKMLAVDESSPKACTLYSTANVAPVKVLASPDIDSVLQRVNGFRNRWTGHGGAVSKSEADDRHELMAAELAVLRGILGRKFLQYQLIEPCECEILEGPVFRCRIRRVMGSNPQLVHDTIDLITPAKTGRLYLHNQGHNKALELLPLVQVCDMPQPAGYFYNRFEGSEPQLVSYHFAEHSEISSDNGALLDLLEDFKTGDFINQEGNG